MFSWLQSLADPYGADNRAPSRDPLRYIFANLRPLWHIVLGSLLLTAVGATIEVWLIGYAGRLVDTLSGTTPAALWTTHGTELAIVAAVVVLVRPLVGLLREGLDDIAFRPNAVTLLRWRAHRHVLGQSVGWFRRDLAGRVATQVAGAGTAATGAAYAVIHTLSFVGVYVLGSLLLVVTIDPLLALPLGVWLVLYLGLMIWIVPPYRRASGAHQAAQSALSGLLVDSYGNIDTLKLFANADTDDRRDLGVFEHGRQAFFDVQRLEVTMNQTMLMLSSLLMAGLIGCGLVLWQQGAAPLGLVAAALALSFRITAMAEWLLDAVSDLFGHLGTLREVLQTVAQPLDVVDAPDAAPLSVTHGTISFSSVSHTYGQGDGGLDRLDLTVAAGEKVGLVGRSGAGKSTLVNLLLRFFDAEDGTITVDGQDIGRVTQASLRRQIAMVTQDAALLHRSIRDNIAYGRPDADDHGIAAAAARAEASDFISRLPHGYDTVVGERGVTLSGGQRQRIALARAILKDAPILLLDEATSALDSEVEAAIQRTLEELMAGKTVIAIAHRLSTIARMDRIVVLDAGRIAEQGTHAALLAHGGLYAMLWQRQSAGFIGD